MVTERSRILGKIRLAGLYAFVMALVIMSRPSPASLAVGATAVVLGETVRLWAAGHLVKSVRLVTSGPYARTQCPLYLGRLLILTGLGLAAHHVGDDRLDGRVSAAVEDQTRLTPEQARGIDP